MASRIAAIARIGIPVIAHIGLLPQTAAGQSGFKVQGREIAAAKQLLRDAKAVAEAGAIAIVVELVPFELAERITKLVSVPTIGIGAGVHCDGQVLVANDMLGADDRFKPRFLKTVRRSRRYDSRRVQRLCRGRPNPRLPDAEEFIRIAGGDCRRA